MEYSFSNRKEQTTDPCPSWVDFKWIMLNKKANPSYILCVSIYVTFLKWHNYGSGEQVRHWERSRQEVWLQRNSTRETCGNGTILCLDCDGAYTKLYVTKLHRITHTHTNECNVNLLVLLLCYSYERGPHWGRLSSAWTYLNISLELPVNL